MELAHGMFEFLVNTGHASQNVNNFNFIYSPSNNNNYISHNVKHEQHNNYHRSKRRRQRESASSGGDSDDNVQGFNADKYYSYR